MGCTSGSPGECDWTVHVRRRCGLLSNYFDHLLNFILRYIDAVTTGQCKASYMQMSLAWWSRRWVFYRAIRVQFSLRLVRVVRKKYLTRIMLQYSQNDPLTRDSVRSLEFKAQDYDVSIQRFLSHWLSTFLPGGLFTTRQNAISPFPDYDVW